MLFVTGMDVYPEAGDFGDELNYNNVNININGNAGEQLPMVNRSRASSLEIRVKPPSSCGGRHSSIGILQWSKIVLLGKTNFIFVLFFFEFVHIIPKD